MNLTSYLEVLPPIKRDKLYSSPWTSQALLRSLPTLAQQYVLRMLYIDTPVETSYVDTWVTKDSQSAHTAALETLRHLQIFRPAKDGSGSACYTLHPTFQQQLRLALSGGTQVSQASLPQVSSYLPTPEELDKYAQGQWESMLLFLLGNVRAGPSLPNYLDANPLSLDHLLTSAGLLTTDQRVQGITEGGFQFLLMDTYSQLWTLLKEYINIAEQKSGAELSSVMSFLMQLGFRRVGQPVCMATLDFLERDIAAHMMQLGLLYPFAIHGRTNTIREDEEIFFCPTRLASSLCGGFSHDDTNSEVAGGYIIVETNYRVYAYTSSPVQISILELFCRKDAILPNLFVGTINRDSIMKALSLHISANQVVNYLDSHAHPHVAKKVPVVPEVVADQIRLWENETRRLQDHAAVLYDNFESHELHQRSVQFARDRGVYLWHDEGKLVVHKEGHEDLKNFIKRMKDTMK